MLNSIFSSKAIKLIQLPPGADTPMKEIREMCDTEPWPCYFEGLGGDKGVTPLNLIEGRPFLPEILMIMFYIGLALFGLSLLPWIFPLLARLCDRIVVFLLEDIPGFWERGVVIGRVLAVKYKWQ
jgi:hypothetical protein